MKRENDGKPPAQPRHGSQIEISTVQIMAVQDIWRARRQVQELPGARKAKIFPTAPLIDGPARVGDGVEEALQCGRAAGLPHPELGPIATTFILTDREDIRIVAQLFPDR